RESEAPALQTSTKGLTISPQLCQKSIASKGPASQATSSRIAGRDHLGISGRHRRNLHSAFDWSRVANTGFRAFCAWSKAAAIGEEPKSPAFKYACCAGWIDRAGSGEHLGPDLGDFDDHVGGYIEPPGGDADRLGTRCFIETISLPLVGA